jgi:hypothetical protein
MCLIEVRLFGDLWRYAGDPSVKAGTAIYLPADETRTVGQVLADLGIGLDEVGNIFINGRLLPRSVYPITLGYVLAADGPLAKEKYLQSPVKVGDRVGIFSRKMSSVVV